MKIEIKSSHTRKREGTSQKTGNHYCFYQQEAWAHLPTTPYPVQIELTWNDLNEVPPPGMYQLAPESYFVDRNKNLSLKPILVAEQKQPLASATKPAA